MKIVAHQYQKEFPTFLNDGKPNSESEPSPTWVPLWFPRLSQQHVPGTHPLLHPVYASSHTDLTSSQRAGAWEKQRPNSVLRMREFFFSSSGCCFTLPLYGGVHRLENELCLQSQWGQRLWMKALCSSHLYPKKQRGSGERYERLMTRLPFLPSPASWVVTELYSYSLIFPVDKDKGGAICHRHPQL